MLNIKGNLLKIATLAGVACALATTANAEGIGVAWVGKSGMAKRVLAGFEARMSEIAPDMEIVVKRELEDTDQLSGAYGELSDKFGAVVVLRSNGSKWLAKNSASVPTFIGGVNHPPSLGVIENMDSPEGKVTGVTYYLDPLIVLETFSAIKAMDSILFIQQEGHPGSEIDKAGFQSACDELFVTCSFVQIPDSKTLEQTVTDNSGHDGIIIGNQVPLFDDEANFKAAVAAAGQTPILGLNRKISEMGGLATLGADDNKLGGLLADKVVAVMRDGKSIAETPVGTDEQPKLVLNTTTQENLGLNVPAQMVEEAELLQ